MSTRSTIACKLSDGSYRSVYFHFDGYPGGVGVVLRDHYNSQEGAEAVTSVGDLSVLSASMECPEGHSYRSPVDGHSIAYGRDRGEKNTEAKLHENLAARLRHCEEYNYTWDGDGWTVRSGKDGGPWI